MLGCFYTAEESKETYDAIRNLAAAPEGQIAFILGKPSTGKTTILQALADEFRSRGDLSVEILS
jgi:chromosomal replication initiation ATPase DnaA